MKAAQAKILDKYMLTVLKEAKSTASHQVIHQARSSALNKALAIAYQSFVRRLVINLCKDTVEKKHVEAK